MSKHLRPVDHAADVLCVSEDAPSGPSRLDRRTPVAELPEFLSPEEFRHYIGIGRSTMYDLVRRGEIPHVKFGRCIRIPKAALTRAVK